MSKDVLSGVAIMGATATGKSGLAIRLAEEFGGEIISMDSRQIYRGLDIGTAKISSADQRRVRHHLIDILEPHERHSAGKHSELTTALVRDVNARGKVPFLVGGTGFYFRALFEGLIDTGVTDEALHNVRRDLECQETSDLYKQLETIDEPRARELSRNDRMRIIRALEIYQTTGKTATEHAQEPRRAPPWRGPRIALTMPRERLRERIAERTKEMVDAGWIDEVQRLLDSGVALDAPAMNSLGYRTFSEGIVGAIDPRDLIPWVVTLTRQYAKRQETFFRGIDDVEWVDVTELDAEVRARELVRHFKSHLT
jgi:tRNA dimethylallyltransferase